MGLDISVFTELVKVNEEDYGWDIVIERNVSQIDRAKDIEPGYYSGKCEFSFRVGAYSSYNFFRKLLSKAILNVEPNIIWENKTDYQDKPFFEIIDFSDCEGYFDAKNSKKLYFDFVEHKDIFEKYLKEQNYDLHYDHYENIYNNFTEGFKIASEKNGVLNFR